MNTKTLLSSLLLTFVAGITPQAHATGEEAEPLPPPQTCQAVRHELDLIAGHLRALPDAAGPVTTATTPYVQLRSNSNHTWAPCTPICPRRQCRARRPACC